MKLHQIPTDLASEEAEAIFKACGQAICEGELVAFPTETVYGLGANGLDADSVKKVFDVKKRPANDPVILHVLNSVEALQLNDLTSNETQIFITLCQKFWPGPLSIVSKAASHIPHEVTASTGFVAVRSPSNAIARRLIEAAGRPIAAPSANPFSRISPTRAEHVQKYFSDTDIHLIVSDDVGQVGIESTVVKIHECDSVVVVQILRHGWVTQTHIEELLVNHCVQYRVVGPPPKQLVTEDSEQAIDHTIVVEGPGMIIKHYSPKLPCFLVRTNTENLPGLSLSQVSHAAVLYLTKSNEIVSLDAQPLIVKRNDAVMDPEKLTQNVFEILHSIEAEASQAGCQNIILVLDAIVFEDDRYSGVLDRLWRAAAGKLRSLPAFSV